jgi:hypothetical protein
VVLFNFVDELTYRARSNLGRRAFEQMKKGVIVAGRLVRAPCFAGSELRRGRRSEGIDSVIEERRLAAPM